MTEDRPLPRFKKPPVEEVSVGLRFNANGFSAVHLGLFYLEVSKDFPHVETLPFLVPEVVIPPDTAPDQMRSLQEAEFTKFFSSNIPQTRLAFKSPDQTTLIQLQGDRLYFNWRSETKSYPRFSVVRAGFVEAYQKLTGFMEKNGLGPIEPILAEVLYVNPLPTRLEVADLSKPEKVFRILNSSNNEDWHTPLHDISFNARYRLNGPYDEFLGWFTANMSSVRNAKNVPKISLQMMARGSPLGKNLDGILAFHDIGHEAIVRNFAAITSDQMHELWEREYE